MTISLFSTPFLFTLCFFLLLCRDRFGFLLALAHGISSEVYLEGVVEQPVAYGVGEGRVTDIRMPVIYGALAGYYCGSCLVTILDYFQQITAFKIPEPAYKESYNRSWLRSCPVRRRDRICLYPSGL